MLIGFFFIMLGGTLEKYYSKTDDPSPSNNPKKISPKKRVYIIDAIIGVSFITPLLIIVYIYRGFWTPFEIRIWVDLFAIGSIIWIATSLPLYVDKINRDTLEIHLFGLHIHETVLGILFIITGFLFIFHHLEALDFVVGSFYLIIGAFLMGRDIEDLRQFKIIERIK